MVSSQTFLCIGLQISLEILLQTGGCSWHLKFKKNITFNNRSHQGSVRFNEGFFYKIFKNSLSKISYIYFSTVLHISLGTVSHSVVVTFLGTFFSTSSQISFSICRQFPFPAPLFSSSHVDFVIVWQFCSSIWRQIGSDGGRHSSRLT